MTGLSDVNCFSFRAADGRFLRHASWRLRLDPNDGTPLFEQDATFCVRAGTVAGSIALQSAEYPGWFIRHRGNELWVDRSDGSAAFDGDTAFLTQTPLGGA